MKIAFLGSKALGLAILRVVHGVSEKESWRIIHPLDESDARSCLEDFTDFARQHDRDLLIASSQAAADEMIRDYRPDVVLVCGWYWLMSGDGHIDWRESAKSIHDFVRSQTRPYPGAFCFAQESKITIWKTAVDGRIFHGRPGQLLSRMPGHVVVSCGHQTALKIFEASAGGLQAPVRDVMPSVKLRLT